MPPLIAVSMPKIDIIRKFKPNIEKANVDPIIVKIPNPIASNFKNRFQCFFRSEYNKKRITAVIRETITKVGSEMEFGRDSLNTTSLMMPPATPVIISERITPTMSALCFIALNAPVTANAIVPKISKI